MLEVNPGDNQGMRFWLVSRLFSLNDLSGVEKVLDAYEDQHLGDWCWNKDLLLFRKDGDSARDVEALDRATKANSFVPEFLTGAIPIPNDLGYYTPGSAEEAGIYASANLVNWSSTKGALFWIRNKTKGIIYLRTKTHRKF